MKKMSLKILILLLAVSHMNITNVYADEVEINYLPKIQTKVKMEGEIFENDEL